MNMNALLIIDPQNDFCNPGDKTGHGKGALYVPNADQDMIRLSWFINANINKIDHIVVTLDFHHYNDISHPNFWTDKSGKHPEPFTKITFQDVIEEKWLPSFEPQKVKEYLQKLENQNKYAHIIWPEHCLIGSDGAAIFKPVLESINNWSKNDNYFQPIFKGMYPFSEHFGAFASQVVYDDVEETKINYQLLDELGSFETIYLAGEAKSHCVASTLEQLINFAPTLVSRLVILEDAMSDVVGFENAANSIYEQAKKLGAKFQKTEDLIN